MSIFRRLASPWERKHSQQQGRGWYPPALRWWSLATVVCLCWMFIGILHYYLHKSQTEGGVVFATNINELPLHRSFWYLYMPTLVAVFFSIFMVWIDHDAKRFEPYRQMCQPDGACGNDCLLLHYPFDFMPIVPLVALKRRHWLVFWASFATVLTTFGIVPVQAGIFSTKQVVQSSPQIFRVSKQFIHSSDQETALTLGYAQATYGVLVLNETLPPFTTTNYTLTPFTAVNRTASQGQTWKAKTTMYSMDLQCEQGRVGTRNITQEVLVGLDLNETDTLLWRNASNMQGRAWVNILKHGFYNSTAGCFVLRDTSNNNTYGTVMESLSHWFGYSHLKFKRFAGSFESYSSYSPPRLGLRGKLSDRCDQGTIFSTFTENRMTASDPSTNVTAVYCKPWYYQQEVEATVDAKTGTPIETVLLGRKQDIVPEVFNAGVFEYTLSTGFSVSTGRTDGLPTDEIPRYLDGLYRTNFSEGILVPHYPRVSYPNLPPMLAMVVTMCKDRLSDLVDPEALGRAYEQAYQILFARTMTDVLKTDSISGADEIWGTQSEQVEAVILEPLFVYLVEALLGLVSMSSIALLRLGYFKCDVWKLADDPSAIATIMSLVADDTTLLSTFDDLDCSSMQYFRNKVKAENYQICRRSSGHSITQAKSPQPVSNTSVASGLITSRLGKPMRPTEFGMPTGVSLISLFIAMMVSLAILFAKSRPHGLSPPSKSQIMQNIITKYLPTAIATLIEPMWIMINRLLGMLQPLEQLRASRTFSTRPIALRYSSLPPQLTIFSAIKNGHLVLAAVCAMSLLANVLATASAGLFFKRSIFVPQSTMFSPLFEARFVFVDSSSGPLEDELQPLSVAQQFGASLEGRGENHFLVAESNLTRNTSLPSWTDETAMYIPFRGSEMGTPSGSHLYEARTKYFRVVPSCEPLVFDEDYSLQFWNPETGYSKFTVMVPTSDGSRTACSGTALDGLLGSETISPGEFCRDGQTAAEIVTTLKAIGDATEKEETTCSSAVAVAWIRAFQDHCSTPFNRFSSDPPRGFEDASPNNIFVMLCQPELRIGDATVKVDATGILQEKTKDLTSEEHQGAQAFERYFKNGPNNLISWSNLFIFRSLKSLPHNDTFASEFIHYFVNRAEGSLRLTDPCEPLPSFKDIEEPFNRAYTRLFALLLGVNAERLLEPANNATKQVEGVLLTTEERLFFTVPLFVISETILSIYIVVSVIVYIQRPGCYLPRMPTSIAAVIALFASSAAVKDFQGTSHMTNSEREEYLKDLDHRYGYGSYVGSDGAVHIGIEKVPYVQVLKKVGFEGTRTETALKKRKVQDSKTAGAGYVNVPLEDTEEGREERLRRRLETASLPDRAHI